VKFRRAQRFLDHYACAAYVVTSRLHVALPCVALGTPAVLLTPDPDDVRFSGYEDMLTILTVEHFLDRDELPAAATILERYRAARPLRTSLTETCERFFTT
jgi:hypothetical protein